MELARLQSNYRLDRIADPTTSYGLHRHRLVDEVVTLHEYLKTSIPYWDANEADKTVLDTPCMQHPYISQPWELVGIACVAMCIQVLS